MMLQLTHIYTIFSNGPQMGTNFLSPQITLYLKGDVMGGPLPLDTLHFGENELFVLIQGFLRKIQPGKWHVANVFTQSIE